MKGSLYLALGAALLLAACSERAANETSVDTSTAPAADTAPLGKLGANATPISYRLDLDLDPDLENFDGAVAIDVDLAHETSLIWLHGKDLDVKEAYATPADGVRIDAIYEQIDITGVAKLDFASALPAGRVTLTVTYSAPFQNAPDGIYRTEEGGDYYAASQLESISARKVFPGFDEPRFKTPFDITVTAKAGDVVATVSPEISAEVLENGMVRHVFETSDPIPTYLHAFLVGPYDVNEWAAIPANSVRSEPLPLRGIAPKGKGDQMDYALENTAEMVRLLEEYFDTPYPYAKLDIIAAPDFFGGAMENVGAIIYNEFLMLMDEDSAFSQRRLYETVHAHELAHQWFGNYVTPAWWDDIWLNESFASWMEYKIASAHWPEGQFDRGVMTDGLNAMSQDSLVNARQIREPVTLNATIDDAFDGITYQKGGAVLAMFETYLGMENFREGVRTHMQRFPHGTATVDDFMQSMADGSGRAEVIPAFRSFIEQPGVPLLNAKLDCDGAPSLKLTQSRYAPLGSAIDANQTWQVPVCAAFGSADGVSSACGLVDKQEITLPLETDSCPAYVVPNGDGSGYFRFALDEAGWAALAQAGQDLTPRQALSYADSLDAAFRADAASATALLDGMTALSRHDAWDVVTATMNNFETLIDLAPGDEARGNIEALGRKLFSPIYDALGDATDSQSVLLRRSLTRFMAVVVLDPAVRAGMLDDARRYVGMNGAPDLDAIAPDQVETVLSVGVQEAGAPFFDALLNLVSASDDAAVRGAGIGALARTEDQGLSLRLLDAVMDESFSASEMNGAFYRQLVRNKTQASTWGWTKAHFDALIERNGGIGAARGLVGIGGSFCTAELGADYEKLILDNREKFPGYERRLAQSLESIDLCVALADAKGREYADAAAARL